MVDGSQILFLEDTTEEMKIKVLRSIADVFKKYEFDQTHKGLVRDLARYVEAVFAVGESYKEVVKEAALELLSCLSFNQIYGISMSMLPF